MMREAYIVTPLNPFVTFLSLYLQNNLHTTFKNPQKINIKLQNKIFDKKISIVVTTKGNIYEI